MLKIRSSARGGVNRNGRRATVFRDRGRLTGRGVSLGRLLITPAVAAAIAAGGVLVALPSAAAADPASVSTSMIQRRHCREVARSSIPVYASSTGTVVRTRFYRGTVFHYFGRVHGRYRTWLPLGVPRPEGYTAYAASFGSRPVRCP